MNNVIRKALAVVVALFTAGAAHATVLTEEFEADFPAWESDWFGVLSDAGNHYCAGQRGCAERGFNLDGLWLGGTSDNSIAVSFDPAFGASLASFQIAVAGYVPTTLSAYDMAGARIFSQDVFLTRDAGGEQASYATYTITSGGGISRFEFSGNAGGNTSVDNLIAVTAEVPEPATPGLIGLALCGAAFARRRTIRPESGRDRRQRMLMYKL